MVDPSTVIQSDPEILGGTAVFRGTRVPVRILFEFLSAGDSLDKFLDAYPSVSREQAVAVLEAAGDLLLSIARPAG
ncbi:MAG TPA: DUF433 domain-containing protein [Alphaproteobacteria bacterium]|nr:DUF433 domain-containing protein [Alphaproteobacteria bacterium]